MKVNNKTKLTCQMLYDVFKDHKCLYYHATDRYGEQYISWEATGGDGFDILLGEFFVKNCKTFGELKQLFEFLDIPINFNIFLKRWEKEGI